MSCTEPRCGHPQTGSGHPTNGWVRVNIAGDPPARWYCTPACAVAALTQTALATTGLQRVDVAACPTCITRHDRDHLCRSCGHAPPRPNFNRVGQPTATREAS